jgi:hypothetical protein
MEQRLFLLPAGEGQDEGERDDIPASATSKKGFENTPQRSKLAHCPTAR